MTNRDGNEGAFRAIFDEHFRWVWGSLRRLGVRESDAEDLAHEVFLAVHRRLADYDPSRPMRPWLFGFAFRIAARHRRSAPQRREMIGVEETIVDQNPRPDEAASISEARSLLMRALDELDLERRAVLVLHEWDGEPIPAVARALEIPLNTAYSRLRLAREDLALVVKRLSRKDVR
ncbi:MAG: sigma-70 family RNA polymerase sigma factor [Labilithrix sp.]|nr:sigma-70 family RNA polymerase sigma factor [Labilithrix sp.]